MNFLLTLRVALLALAKNKLRAGLTVLGVVIGIAAVTAMVSIGQSLSALIESQFSLLGTNVIIVMPANMRRGPVMADYTPKLTSQDSSAIAEECPSVLVTSPLIGAQGQHVTRFVVPPDRRGVEWERDRLPQGQLQLGFFEMNLLPLFEPARDDADDHQLPVAAAPSHPEVIGARDATANPPTAGVSHRFDSCRRAAACREGAGAAQPVNIGVDSGFLCGASLAPLGGPA